MAGPYDRWARSGHRLTFWEGHVNRLKLATYSLVGFGPVLALPPDQAHAACSQWDMPAQMLIHQSNNTRVTMQSTPAEGGFVGTAQAYKIVVHDGIRVAMDGPLEGRLVGSDLQFTVHWRVNRYDESSLHSTGVYTGTVGPQGRVTGSGYDAEHRETKATWWAEEVLQCRDGAAPTQTEQIVTPLRPPPVPLGRKQPIPRSPDPFERKGIPMSVILAPPPICKSAQSARARNSPAAPGLERQCQVAMEQAAAAAR